MSLKLSIVFTIFSIQWILAQPVERESPAGQDFTLYTGADLVVLNVGVQDGHGRNVRGLTPADFKVYEDGRLQPVKQFSDEDRPVTIGIVVDASGSMLPKQAEVITAALAFSGASNPQDEIFVVEFNDNARLELPPDTPFTRDLLRLRTALMGRNPAGKTALYDAVDLALQHLRKGKWEKKALLVVSDGGDNNSKHSWQDILEQVQASGATLYTIGVFDDEDPDRNAGNLRRLAEMSGGESFFPKTLPDIEPICRRIAADIRASYTLAFTPQNSDESEKPRKLKISASHASGGRLVVHSRSSYVLTAR